MPSPNKEAIKVHVDPELKLSYEAYAQQLGVSVNWLCNQALVKYRDSLPPIHTAHIKIEGEEE